MSQANHDATAPVPTPESLVAQQGELPAMASILSNVQRLLRSDDTTTSDIAELLKLDAAMAGRLVKISNSAIFRRGEHVRSLEDALMRIGFAEIREVVSLVLGAAMLSKPLHAYGRSATQAWHESVGCATAASLIADALGEDSGVAYTAGLFHLIGRGPIDAWMRQNRPKLLLENVGFPVHYAESERHHLGFSQSEVAALMLGSMKFAPEIVESVRQQDESLLNPELRPRLRYILAAARLVYEREFGDESRGAPPLADTVLNLLDMSPHKLEHLLPEFRLSIERAIQISYC